MDPLQIILNTLNQVEVKGIKNINYMLAAMQLLQQLIDLKNQPKEETDKNKQEG